MSEAGNVEPGPRRRPLRVVVMDDEFWICEIFKLIFECYCPDATVLTFLDAEAALAELDREEPDLFTTDWNHCGELHGEGLLRALAARGVKYPVFVISAYGPEIHKQDLLKGVRDAGLNVTMLCKPFTVEDFRRLVSAQGLKLERPSVDGSV
jgi:DNA-binding NtrC family response regulator